MDNESVLKGTPIMNDGDVVLLKFNVIKFFAFSPDIFQIADGGVAF